MKEAMDVGGRERRKREERKGMDGRGGNFSGETKGERKRRKEAKFGEGKGVI